jgi:calcineurin-like phosphoesterase
MLPIEKGEMIFNSVLIETDNTTKKTTSISRIDEHTII